MSNYKGLTFPNSLNGFKDWCNKFPPMEVGKDRHHFENGDYYCSIELVSMMGATFAGLTFRKYDRVSQDFKHVDRDYGETLFEDQINRVKRRWKL